MPSFVGRYFEHTAPHALKPAYPSIAGLHLNEMPRDIPYELRDRVAERLRKISYNRYPEPYADSLAQKLAAHYGCDSNEILVGPGSSAFIRLLLTYFGMHMQGRLVITRPSFAYYEQFCRAFGIAYDTWELDEQFQYDLTALDTLPPYSVVCLTSPNNPTGNLLTVEQAELLLRTHPDSLFIVDEAYAEFTDQQMAPLLRRFDNLLLLRTMSKAFGVAGIRCGSIIGEASFIKAIAGLQTPWQLPAATVEAAKVALEYLQETNWTHRRVTEVIHERDRLVEACRAIAGQAYRIYPSYGNFLLIQAATTRAYSRLTETCAAYLIRVSELDAMPRLARCVRVTIGKPEENDLFYEAFQEALNRA